MQEKGSCTKSKPPKNVQENDKIGKILQDICKKRAFLRALLARLVQVWIARSCKTFLPG
ncbi:hypothetical protein SPBRAN_1140 [uncultured Candidatus Thioglobus sp.]|nr:hypothetical protein SPBRAN_1140 [uncultured Candidatus Thioglobus sp.]